MVRLPQRATVVDLIDGKTIARNVTEFELAVAENTTSSKACEMRGHFARHCLWDFAGRDQIQNDSHFPNPFLSVVICWCSEEPAITAARIEHLKFTFDLRTKKLTGQMKFGPSGRAGRLWTRHASFCV